jgi:hypothetical protein
MQWSSIPPLHTLLLVLDGHVERIVEQVARQQVERQRTLAARHLQASGASPNCNQLRSFALPGSRCRCIEQNITLA